MDSVNNVQHLDPSTSSNLMRIQSKDHEEILDVIDQLRSEGVGKYVDLPQLIVCGDQSSGKSSVLEAISGLSFPRKDTVCTRFATELILRRAPAVAPNNISVIVSIVPDPDRPSVEKERISQFRSPTLELNSFEEIVRSAETSISAGKDTSGFFRDVLRVEVAGPDQPHLTLVDLPGLYHASDEHQTEQGIKFVEKLVLSYVQSKRSVILAVMSAKNDKALQKVTTLIRKIDPNGKRTMGIITKPDTLPKGSEAESSYFNLAQNKNSSASFRLGWHVLKNRTFEERHFSLAERNESEANFFSQGIWSSMPKSHVGIDTLRPRLSLVLKDHILDQLPGFIAETQASCKETTAAIQKLGQPRQTIFEQRRYLLQSSEKFNALARESFNGLYIDAFFGDALEEKGYQRRLRAVVQNRLMDFSNTMHAHGQKQKIFEDTFFFGEFKEGVQRSVFVEEVRQRMRRSRGRELPGTFNPLIVGELFYIQSQPWVAIADEYMELLLQDLKKATVPILYEVLDNKSIEGVLNHVVNPCLAELGNSLRQKTAELLQPQRVGHPITYNRDFTDAIQKARDRHFRKTITNKLRSFFGADFPVDLSSNLTVQFSMKGLIDVLVSQTETDVERFACSEAVDCMEAYYNIAIKKFIDDFGNLAVEKCLLQPMLDVFGPQTVERMADEVVEDIAGEDRSTIQERTRLTDKRSVLEKSLARLNRLDRHKATAPSPSPRSPAAPDETSKNDTNTALSQGIATPGATSANGINLSTADTNITPTPAVATGLSVSRSAASGSVRSTSPFKFSKNSFTGSSNGSAEPQSRTTNSLPSGGLFGRPKSSETPQS